MVRSMLHTQKPPLMEFMDVYGLSVDDARNYLVECFKVSDAEYLLFADNDATWAPDAILRLLEHKLPMVCACMYTKPDDLMPMPTIGRYIGKTPDGKSYYRFSDTAKEIVTYVRSVLSDTPERNAICLPQDKNSLRSVDGVGMHFTLIRRDVINALKMPYFKNQHNSVGGEDFYFCRHVREAGFPIYYDLAVHTGHAVGEEDGQDWGIRQVWLRMQGLEVNDIQEANFQLELKP
jgi:GT2 family glycosyltransferase